MGKVGLSVEVRDCDFDFWPADLKVLGKMPVLGETGTWVCWTASCVQGNSEEHWHVGETVEGESQERTNEGGMVSNRCKGE